MPPRIIYANPSTTLRFVLLANSVVAAAANCSDLLSFACRRQATRHVYFLPDLRPDFLSAVVYFRVISAAGLRFYAESMNHQEWNTSPISCDFKRDEHFGV
jgi:hypothetical protein